MAQLRIYDVIEDEYFNINKEPYKALNTILTPARDRNGLINKIINYDPDIKDITDKLIFSYYSLPSSVADVRFKKLFINRNLNKSIKRETVDEVSHLIVAGMIQYEEYITFICESTKKLLDRVTSNDYTNTHRDAFQDLAQSSVNIDLNDNTFNFATNNGISLDRNESSNKGLIQATELSKLLKIEEIIFKSIESKIFSRLWI